MGQVYAGRVRETIPRRLPRGRHALPPEVVEQIQRERLCFAMAEVMAEKGYEATSVQDVLQRAGVSRKSFYELFGSKMDCFMAAFAGAGRLLVGAIGETLAQAGAEPSDPLRTFEEAITAYLDTLASEIPYARLFLVEANSAGPDAIQTRAKLQTRFADVLADLLGVRGEQGRFSCRLIVAAISALVTPLLAVGDTDGLRALGAPMIEHVTRLWNAGAFGD